MIFERFLAKQSYEFFSFEVHKPCRLAAILRTQELKNSELKTQNNGPMTDAPWSVARCTMV